MSGFASFSIPIQGCSGPRFSLPSWVDVDLTIRLTSCNDQPWSCQQSADHCGTRRNGCWWWRRFDLPACQRARERDTGEIGDRKLNWAKTPLPLVPFSRKGVPITPRRAISARQLFLFRGLGGPILRTATPSNAASLSNSNFPLFPRGSEESLKSQDTTEGVESTQQTGSFIKVSPFGEKIRIPRQ